MSVVVLDASAVLAVLQRERSHEVVATAMVGGAAISAVNLSEVVAKLADGGMPAGPLREVLDALGLEVVLFDEPLAYAAGLLRPATRDLGLSLGDRACLALGQARAQPILTTDTAWTTLALDPPVHVQAVREPRR